MCEYIFIFWELWMDYFCEYIEYVLKSYDKSWLETQYDIYSLVRENHTATSL